jgi:uncharacterized protein YjbJ (UPF0337 family)
MQRYALHLLSGKLTDDDWAFVGGKKDALVGKLQEHDGYQKDQAEKEVDDFISKGVCKW